MMPNDTNELHAILARSIHPNIDLLAHIFLRNEIAIILHETDRSRYELLRQMGWNGKAHVFGLRRSKAAQTIGKTDYVTAAWIQRQSKVDVGRIFVLARQGSLLVNYKPGEGYSIESSSTRTARAAMADAAERINAPFVGMT
ncbi:hypothetical protein LZC95_35155 [Pendulispora brunnea]|uniref:Uncharacterized protein n=1 Tax=Pendulispora brunnea TaxID=2905690 RepID=A0ABZ2JYV4_9BACT